MATTASDIQAQAAVDAWLKSQSLKDMQQSIEDAYNAGVGQASASNQLILNQLNANRDAYNRQYDTDARSAYLNKMQGDTLVNTELARLGLDDSGFGVSQKLANQGVYSQNLTSLKSALSTNLAGVDLAQANQEAAYKGQLQKLLQEKASAQYDYNRYVAEMSEKIRQQEISNYLQNKYYDYLYANANAGKGSSSSGSSSSGGVSLGGSSSSGGNSGGSSGGGNSKPTQSTTGNTQPSNNSGSMKPRLTTAEFNKLVKQLSIGKNAGGALGANWANMTKTKLNQMYHNNEISQSELKLLFDRLGLK